MIFTKIFGQQKMQWCIWWYYYF